MVFADSFELVINRDLKTIGQPVVHVGDTDDAHQFAKHRLSHTLIESRHTMRGDAVFASVGHADRQIDQFAHERIQFTGSAHHLFQGIPGPCQRRWVIGNHLPEIIDLVRLARGTDVIIDLSHQAGALVVFDEWLNRITPVI